MSTLSLEERIKKLEDIEAIKDLMAHYAFYTNKGWNGKVVNVEEMPSIYAKDAKVEDADMHINIVGLDEIMKDLPHSTADVDFSMHSFLNPIIVVDGDKATGKWLLWIGSKIKGSARAVFMSADFTYVRTTQGWRIQTGNEHFGMLLAADQRPSVS